MLKKLLATQPRRRDQLSVAMHQNLLRRIAATIENSDIEEGGKLLGYIERSPKNVTVHAVTYIDSGPNVSSSSTHIIPDGVYQESVFRVLEHLDPAVEHIGSWHSHHCNGYPHLSEGDIRGYLESVNDPRYNLDLFYVVLVLGIEQGALRCRHFLFVRGEPSYYELRPQSIITVEEDHRFEPILAEMEKATRQVRARCVEGPRQRISNPGTVAPLGDELAVIRMEDKAWLEAQFANPMLIRSKATGTLSWRWQCLLGTNCVQFKLTYPASVTQACCVEASSDGALLSERQIPLDRNRHAAIADFLQGVELESKREP